MNKRDKAMLTMLSEQINFYGDALARARNMHEFAADARNTKLAVAAKAAADGLNELVSHFSLYQDTIMKKSGAVHVPIKSDKEHYEIHFKEIRAKNNSSLW